MSVAAGTRWVDNIDIWKFQAHKMGMTGCNTGWIGKKHLGDSDETLTNNQGFDDDHGALVHLNASAVPESPDYFKDPALIKQCAPRAMIHSRTYAKGTQRTDKTLFPMLVSGKFIQ